MRTHCLADAGVSRLIYAAYKDPAGEGDVEAEVDQHVPKLAAHADRPGIKETKSNTHHKIENADVSYLLTGLNPQQ